MNIRDLKYLIAYLTPFMGWLSLVLSGWLSFSAIIFMFGFVPIVDALFKGETENHVVQKESKRNASLFFDLLLYLNLPIIYFLLWQYFTLIASGGLSTVELIGKTISIGFIGGAIGINVAHEIGHRPKWYNQWISRFLLLPELYLHFNIEHNRGHHMRVATPEDPATSRYGETFYSFWLRTVFGGIRSAWEIESREVIQRGHKKYSIYNEMIQFAIIQGAYLLLVGIVFGYPVIPFAILVAIAGFTLLESVNYIEHYGLVREKSASGRYEPVQEHHSWNSNHPLGRILLYELTRHSDHHYKSTRKYQVLRHFDTSPQMPLGYPGSMLLAFIPPLWFYQMHQHPTLSKAKRV